MAVVCPTCGAESDYCWRCSACGKPFEGDEETVDRSPLGGAA